MKKGLLGLGIVLVGVLLLAYAVFGRGWYKIEAGLGGPSELSGLSLGADINVGLKSVSVCMLGMCESAPYARAFGVTPGGYFAAFSNGMFFGGIIVMLLLVGAVALTYLQDRNDLLKKVCKGSLVLLPLGVGCILTFPVGGGEAHLGVAMWCVVLGVGAAFTGSYLVSQEGTVQLSTEVPSSAMPRPAAAAPSATPRPAVGLRFAASKLSVDDRGVTGTTDDGQVTVLEWADLATLRCAILPPHPVLGRLLIVDLGPLMGPPIRATSQTRLELPEAGAVPAENLRKLVKLASDRSPSATVDAATRAFSRGQPPPTMTQDEWKDYDSRLG